MSGGGPLPRAFYARPTLDVLRTLIGKVLVHETPEGRASGIIIEAEAYIGETDPACHAAPGPTPRNAPLYGEPGLAYVYLNYGLHHLINAVTEEPGSPAAVLIRALDPCDGQALMRARRQAARRPRRTSPRAAGRVSGGRSDVAMLADEDLCRGPGNLTVALGIDLTQNGADLRAGALTIVDARIPPPPLAWSPRIGIRVGTEMLWRCVWRDHPGVSGPRGGKGGC